MMIFSEVNKVKRKSYDDPLLGPAMPENERTELENELVGVLQSISSVASRMADTISSVMEGEPEERLWEMLDELEESYLLELVTDAKNARVFVEHASQELSDVFEELVHY